MKPSLLGLFLCLAAIACGDGLQNIPLTGCYCDDIPGVYRSGTVMIVGEDYRLTNGTHDAISVIVMPGAVQSLGSIMPGETRSFTAIGTSMLINARGHAGEPVRNLRLVWVRPMGRANPKQPPAQ